MDVPIDKKTEIRNPSILRGYWFAPGYSGYFEITRMVTGKFSLTSYLSLDGDYAHHSDTCGVFATTREAVEAGEKRCRSVFKAWHIRWDAPGLSLKDLQRELDKSPWEIFVIRNRSQYKRGDKRNRDERGMLI